LLHDERDNIAKALSRALQLETAWDATTDLLLAFHPYTEPTGSWTEWEWYLEAGLQISREKQDVASEAALLDRLGDLKRDRGEWAAAAAYHEQAYQLSSTVGNEAGCARALTSLATFIACRASMQRQGRLWKEH